MKKDGAIYRKDDALHFILSKIFFSGREFFFIVGLPSSGTTCPVFGKHG